MNLVEIDHALRKLRLSGMADGLEARLRQAQVDRQVPLDLVSALVGDELLRREDRLITRRLQQARFRDPDRSLDTFDFDFNKKMSASADPRARNGPLHPAARRRPAARAAGDRQESPGAGARTGRHPPRASRRSIARRTHCSKRSPKPRSTARGRPTSPTSRPTRCSSSTTSACGSSRTPPPKTCSK